VSRLASVPLFRILVPFAVGIALEDLFLAHWGAAQWDLALGALGRGGGGGSSHAWVLFGGACSAWVAFSGLARWWWRATAERASRPRERALTALGWLLEPSLCLVLGALSLALRHEPALPTDALAPGEGTRLIRIESAPRPGGRGCRARAWLAPRGSVQGMRVELSLPDASCDLSPGDWALGRVELRPLRGPRNPGGADRRRQARRRGIQARAWLEMGWIAPLAGPGRWGTLRRVQGRIRSALGAVLDPIGPAQAPDETDARDDDPSEAHRREPDPSEPDRREPYPSESDRRESERSEADRREVDPRETAAIGEPDPAGEPDGARTLLRALVIGDRSRLPIWLRSAFERAGTAHLLAVSGLHVGFVFGGVRLVAAAALRRSRRRRVLRGAQSVATIGALVLAVAYAGLTGFGVPALRAASMGLAGGLAFLGGRRPARWNALAAAALLCLVLDPASLFELGLWLSFAAVAGILLWAPGPGALSGAAGATCAASLATAPLIAALGGTLPLAGVLVNAWAVPWFGWLVLPAALAAAIFGAICGEVGLPAASNPLLELALWACRLGIRGIVWSESPDLLRLAVRPILWAFALLGFGAAARAWWQARAAARHPMSQAQERGLRRARSGLVALGVVFGLLSLLPRRSLAPGELRVWFLDVGHGDAVLIRSAEGSWIVDAGAAVDGFDAGRSVVLPALRELGVRELRGVVVTHSDRDHIGGVAALLREIPVETLVWTRRTAEHPAARAAGRVARERDISMRRIVAGDRLTRPDEPLQLQVLWPPRRLRSRDANSSSVVLRVGFGAECLVLSGDAPAEVERALLREVAACRILKLGHHGSHSSSSVSWLDAVEPELAVASAGVRRAGSLPHPEVRRRLLARHITLYETHRFGAIELRLFAGELPRAARWVAMPFVFPEVLPEMLPKVLPEKLPEGFPERPPEVFPEMPPDVVPEVAPESSSGNSGLRVQQ